MSQSSICKGEKKKKKSIAIKAQEKGISLFDLRRSSFQTSKP